MIITKTLKITITNNTRQYYSELGYKIPKTRNPEIEINIKDLPKHSNLKIECKCDICGKICNISHHHYNKNIKSTGTYSCKGKCSRIKFKNTCLENYGVENPFQNKNIKTKSKKTLQLKYNVDNISKSQTIKNLHKTRNMKLYGVKNYFDSYDFKIKSEKTIRKIYGDISNVFQNEEIKDKIKSTNLKRYGVEYPMQNIIIFNKQQTSGFNAKKYLKTELYYRGTYELDFLNKYKQLKITNGKTIKYTLKNETRIYFPDFYYLEKNLIIEIKSDYYYNLCLEKNLAKQKACIDQGYNFIFIINKNYSEFEKII